MRPRVETISRLSRKAAETEIAAGKSVGEAESVKLAWRPQVRVEVAETDAESLFKLIDALDDDDDDV